MLLALPLSACDKKSADTQTDTTSGVNIDGIYYNLDAEAGTAEVTYLYSSPSNSTAYRGRVVIPSTVIYDGVTYEVTSIGDYAFFCCDSLTEVTLGNYVEEIGANAFSGCTSLTAFHVDSGNRELCSINGILYSKDMEALILCPTGYVGNCVIPTGVKVILPFAFDHCGSLTSVVISNTVTDIFDAAFRDCALTEVTIGDSVTSIGYRAFDWCWNLTAVTIPNSVTSFGGCTFMHCSNLKEVTIGKSVTDIGDAQFCLCNSLEVVTCLNPEPPVGTDIRFQDDTFGEISPCTLYVPKGSKEKYASAEGWKDFEDIREIAAQ